MKDQQAHVHPAHKVEEQPTSTTPLQPPSTLYDPPQPPSSLYHQLPIMPAYFKLSLRQ